MWEIYVVGQETHHAKVVGCVLCRSEAKTRMGTHAGHGKFSPSAWVQSTHPTSACTRKTSN